MTTKGELSSFWHDKNWIKIIALRDFIQEYEFDHEYRNGLYMQARDQIIELIRGNLDIENVMGNPDSPTRNCYILMWIDMQKWGIDKEEFKKQYSL